jgi:hypothetical protein
MGLAAMSWFSMLLLSEEWPSEVAVWELTTAR